MLPTATSSAPSSVILGEPILLALTNAQVPGYPAATSFTYAFDCGAGLGFGTAGRAGSSIKTAMPRSTPRW